MANVKISELPTAVANADGIVPFVTGGITSQTTVNDIVNVASGIQTSDAHIKCSDSLDISVSGHYIPTENEQFDIGSAEKKVRHLFLSSNSLYMGDGVDPLASGNKISFDSDELVVTSTDGVTTSKSCLIPSNVPLSPSTSGKVGQIAVDENNLYLCNTPNNWVRIPLAGLVDGTFVNPTTTTAAP